MVKLLVDAHTFDETHQGIRSFLKGIYSALDVSSGDIEVYLAANDIENLKAEFKDQKSFKYIRLKHRNKYLRLAYEIPKMISQHNIDFAHFNYYLPLFLSKDCRYIVTIHDVLFIDFPQYFPLKYRLINTFMFRRSARRAEILNTVSHYSAERIRECFRIGNKPIQVVPNSVGKHYLKQRDKADDRSYIKDRYQLDNFILYVSRIEPRKNHVMTLRVYMELKLWERGYKLVFVGKESIESKELKELVSQLREISPNSLVMLEDVSNEELVMFYNAASLCMFLSFCEGFGIPPLESGVLKTPTLCSNSTAMRDFEFFKESLVDPYDKEQIKSKIIEILEEINSAESARRLEAISEAIKERYSWNNSAEILKNSININTADSKFRS